MHGQQITRHLLDEGLVNAGDILAEQLVLVPEKRDRFVIWKVSVRDRPRYLVKCPRNRDSKQRLAQETDSLALLSGIAATRHLVPAIYPGGTERQYIVMQYIHPAGPMNRFVPAAQADDLWITLAATLSCLHDSTRGIPPMPENELPWVFSVLEKDFYWKPEELQPVLALNRDNRWLRDCLHRCRQAWQAECLIHGDIKLEHCLVDSGSRAICLIDWELGIQGDPAWDLAGVLNELILNYATPDSLTPALDRFELFFRDYGMDRQDSPDTLPLYERSLQFTSARLFQSCLELAAVSSPPGEIRKLLHYARTLRDHAGHDYSGACQDHWSVAL